MGDISRQGSPLRQAWRAQSPFRPGQMPAVFGDTAAALIIDDEDETAAMLARLLTREGYKCTVASDAAAARALLEVREYAVALVDVLLPGESGLDLVAGVLEDHPDLAVVIVSGLDDPAVSDLAWQRGAYGYIVKPFRPSQVLITVANASSRRCLEIERREHLDRVEWLMVDQAANLSEARNELKEARAHRGGTLADHSANAPTWVEKLQVLVDLAADATVAMTTDGSIALINAQAERLFGYDRHELLGAPVGILIPEAARTVDSTPRPVDLASTRPSTTTGRGLKARRKDGTVFSAEISLSAMDTEDSVLISAAIRDLSEPRRADHAEPEPVAGVASPHADLDVGRQRESLPFEDYGPRTGVIAHDFNNLLGVISNYALFVSEKVAAASEGDNSQDWSVAQRDIAQIQRAADRATRLADELLSFARPRPLASEAPRPE